MSLEQVHLSRYYVASVEDSRRRCSVGSASDPEIPAPLPGQALVTGASSGLGEAFARRLAQDGYDVVLVARRRERLEALASELRRRHGVNLEVLVADLQEPADVRVVEQQIADSPSLTLLVNSAGVAGDADATIQVNVAALARLTRAALPGMIGRGTGNIVNVASIAAFLTSRSFAPELLTATYAASKAFVVTYCQRLHRELRGTGVQVQALCPGWTPTEMANPADLAEIIPRDAWMPVDDVVQASLVGLARGEIVCVPALAHAELLDELDRVKNGIIRETATTGVLADRYRASGLKS